MSDSDFDWSEPVPYCTCGHSENAHRDILISDEVVESPCSICDCQDFYDAYQAGIDEAARGTSWPL